MKAITERVLPSVGKTRIKEIARESGIEQSMDKGCLPQEEREGG